MLYINISSHFLAFATNENLVGLWPLTFEYKGNDLSGYANNIKFNDIAYKDACAKCPKVVYFKGTKTSFGIIPGSGELHIQKAFTWMAWLNLESLQDGPLLEWYYDNEEGTRIWIHQSSLHYGIGKGYGNIRLDNGYGQKKWDRFALSYDGKKMKVYVNGGVKILNKWARSGLDTKGDIHIGVR